MAKNNQENNDAFITTEQLAERWKLSSDHLEVKRMRGDGPPWVKLGDSQSAPVRYRLSDVVAYEDGHLKTSTKPKRKH